jgi:hypothetical protein
VPWSLAFFLAPQVFEFVAGQGGSPGYVGRSVTNKTRVGGPACVPAFVRLHIDDISRAGLKACLPNPPESIPVPLLASSLQLNFNPQTQGEFRVYVINLQLRDGAAYFMRIYARNGAGLEGFRCGVEEPAGCWGM